MSVSPSPVVAVNVLQSPIVDTETGYPSRQWLKWFQNISQAVNNGLTMAGTALKLPFPSLGSLGGVKASRKIQGQWVSQIDPYGVPQLSQPAVTDIQGLGVGAVTATSATAGGATALPATPAGYLTLSINGTSYKVPFYAL